MKTAIINNTSEKKYPKFSELPIGTFFYNGSPILRLKVSDSQLFNFQIGELINTRDYKEIRVVNTITTS